MTDRYQEIRNALAMGPTPGPWEVINGTDVFTPLGARNAAGVEAAADDGWHVADCDMGLSFTKEGKEEKIPYEEKLANADFIAACDPDTIRELLAERDALKVEIEALKERIYALEEALGHAREALANLDKSHYRAAKRDPDKRGYVMGNVPVASLIIAIEAARKALAILDAAQEKSQ